ncbi:MAG: hypothetical protein A2268_00510 [Candidatus Raymondbacteria bacterium RifOxyA12_full_50_37]|uniref:Secretion system C-terminal sorting domain-containing protein n=1 Tax=Candidatus Raymondbacteria bacterium RIFOXYD12_FULL_49_13 TaxID=1817890 RepID=A0A1F7F3B0_UNCRA|nr:MAG: hypothetical protein A2350_08995 [Candidatus Raymondbacteria bacterium RifOxyB12_full_50_8]OGJ91465.1 MAG: hypothetical protein A2268_00510 [Candidatus Raymondbacteria bacterium RifOxyA12_full_50_37]OGJ92795.1 MAG: hypothetical protein A2248_04560 [Candidatus Raymondbacteria bacterium RIFOXYA2_FULL_49_16]OGJ96676.1 MAG: hypothetical protein A2487_09400 [Candidatus Raymondbacteria bacterium RifOxyC12_full_50_8]OGK00996.1 MAG: hypothetical protein A2519_17225 [Candidatus Raymondbacteria b
MRTTLSAAGIVLAIFSGATFAAFNDWFNNWAANQLPTYAATIPADSAEWNLLQQKMRDGLKSTLSLEKFDPFSDVIVKTSVDKGAYTTQAIAIPVVGGYYTTAILYVPKTGGPRFPAIINHSGHWTNGKNDQYYMTGINKTMVNEGYIIIHLDMGFSTEFGTMSPNHDRHYGQLCEVFGFGVAQMQLRSLMRTVDYLFTRNDVDTTRIGATGSSGGGTATYWFGAVDDRVKASIPLCSSMNQMFFGQKLTYPICDVLPFPGFYAQQWQFTAMAAPRAFFMLQENASNPNPAEWDTYVKPVWDTYGNASTSCKWMQIGQHDYDEAKQVLAAQFFNLNFFGNQGSPVGNSSANPPADYLLDPFNGSGWLTGNESYKNNAAWVMYTLSQMWLGGIAPPLNQAELEHRIDTVRTNIMADAFRALPKNDVSLNASGATIHVDPAFSLDLSITNGSGSVKPVFIVISPEGATGLSGLRAALAGKGYAVVTATFRGTGDNRYTESTSYADMVDYISNLGIRIFGGSTLALMYYDIKRVLDYLHTQTWCDTAKIGIAGEDIGGMAALITAMMDDRVDMVGTKGQLYSWMHKPTTHRVYGHMLYATPKTAEWHQASWPYGIGKYADLTMMPGLAYPCASYIGGGDVWFNIYGTYDGARNDRTSLNQNDLDSAYKWSTDVFNNLGKNQNMRIKAGATDQEMADWFEARINAGDIENRTTRPISSIREKQIEKWTSLEVSPNPFNPTTRITVSGLKPGEKPEIKIYSVYGKLIDKISSDFCILTSGYIWDASALPSGIYFITVRFGKNTMAKKAMLVR